MRRRLVTATPLEPVSSFTYKMIMEDIGAVFVVEDNRTVGIITAKDILEWVVTTGKDVYTTLARDVMSKPVVSIEASHTIKEALDLMKKNKIRRLAVTENASLVGLITDKRLLARVSNLIL
jgi:CBS domain-containing protein